MNQCFVLLDSLVDQTTSMQLTSDAHSVITNVGADMLSTTSLPVDTRGYSIKYQSGLPVFTDEPPVEPISNPTTAGHVMTDEAPPASISSLPSHSYSLEGASSVSDGTTMEQTSTVSFSSPEITFSATPRHSTNSERETTSSYRSSTTVSIELSVSGSTDPSVNGSREEVHQSVSTQKHQQDSSKRNWVPVVITLALIAFLVIGIVSGCCIYKRTK